MPEDLVEAAKLREISQLEFSGNSIEGLAFEWSQAVAVQGLSSPDDAIAQFERVTVADVNRVLRTYLDDDHVVTAYVVPKSAGAATAGSEMAKENNEIPPSTHQPLPSWAQHVLDGLQVPQQTLAPSDTILSNGIRLIVQPETITHTVVVAGEIRNDPGVQEPPNQEGVSDLTESLLPYGTTTYDRLALQRELDAIAASTSAGTQFGLEVLSSHFERGVQLLADEELHPAFDSGAFSIVRDQLVGELTGDMSSPDHLSEVALAKALYPPGDPSQRFATPKSVGALTPADVRSWFASAYRPDLTTIVVIGDTTPEAAKTLFERYFGSWSAVGPKPNVEPPPVPQNAAQPSRRSGNRTRAVVGAARRDARAAAHGPGLAAAPAGEHRFDRRVLLIAARARPAGSARLCVFGEQQRRSRRRSGQLRHRVWLRSAERNARGGASARGALAAAAATDRSRSPAGRQGAADGSRTAARWPVTTASPASFSTTQRRGCRSIRT